MLFAVVLEAVYHLGRPTWRLSDGRRAFEVPDCLFWVTLNQQVFSLGSASLQC